MDLCNHCNTRVATIYISMTINGAALEVKLCNECANHRAETGVIVDVPVEGTVIPDMEEQAGKLALIEPERYSSVCRSCGLTAQEFTQTQLLGCDMCYVAHAELLEKVFETIRGTDPSVGELKTSAHKQLEVATRMKRLMGELQEAVRLEEYVRAARLRDEIRALCTEANNASA